MNLMPAKRRIFLWVAAALFLSAVFWIVLSLRDDDSTLNVLIRYAKDVKERACWPEDSSVFCVLAKMQKYEKKNRYDEAISAGIAWMQGHPDDFLSGLVYRDLSVLYLKKAKQDKPDSERNLKQVIFYRDKALASSSDNAYALQPLVVITESVGDLSASQRCVEYRNSLKLLDQMNLLTMKKKDQVARQFKPDPNELKEIECLSEWIDGTSKRLTTKVSTSGCQ